MQKPEVGKAPRGAKCRHLRHTEIFEAEKRQMGDLVSRRSILGRCSQSGEQWSVGMKHTVAGVYKLCPVGQMRPTIARNVLQTKW